MSDEIWGVQAGQACWGPGGGTNRARWIVPASGEAYCHTTIKITGGQQEAPQAELWLRLAGQALQTSAYGLVPPRVRISYVAVD